LKDKVNYLLKKNNILENEKNENNQRIDILEKKIDKLINYIKINELSNLKNKINSLENNVNHLKTENEKLKKEIHKKFLDLNFTKIDKINRSIIKKKNNSGIDKYKGPIFYDSKTKYNLKDSDIQRIKLISIDPDKL
jgi:seryl-tRNA synthetase